MTQTVQRKPHSVLALFNNPAFDALKDKKIWCYAEIIYQADGKKQVYYHKANGEPIRADTRRPYTTGMNAFIAMSNRETKLQAYRKRNATKPLPLFCLAIRLGNGLLAIDPDECRDAKTGTLDAWAQTLVDSFPTYWESSISGTGIHGLMYASIADTATKTPPLALPDAPAASIEMMLHDCYILFTGKQIGNEPIASLQDEAQALYDRIGGKYTPPTVQATLAQTPTLQQATITLPDDVLPTFIRCGQTSKDGLFEKLWSHNWLDIPKYKRDPNRADMALCMLIYRNCLDAGITDNLFRLSGLMRSKWDEPNHNAATKETYGQMTNRKVIASYTPVKEQKAYCIQCGRVLTEEQKAYRIQCEYITHITHHKKSVLVALLADMPVSQKDQYILDLVEQVQRDRDQIQAYKAEERIRETMGQSVLDASILIAIRLLVLQGIPNEQGYTAILRQDIAALSKASLRYVDVVLKRYDLQGLIEQQKNAPRYETGNRSLRVKLSDALLSGIFQIAMNDTPVITLEDEYILMDK